MIVKKHEKMNLWKDVIDLFYNRHTSISDIAFIVNKSPRTIYRWLQNQQQEKNLDQHPPKQKSFREKRFNQAIFDQILQFKQEHPVRTAVTIRSLLQKTSLKKIPSLTTIRKYLADHGLAGKDFNGRNGYIKFERKPPNSLWQIDIAGVQSIEYLGKVYLFAVLDDCSRFIPAAFYFPNEKGLFVIQLLRQAIIQYERPNQILSDNGSQFKAILSELGTKYTRLLTSIGVEPIHSRLKHPQTKVKLERWFETVNKSFLSEARFIIKQKPTLTWEEFNQMFTKWLHWYNYEKSHRSLPHTTNPDDVYFNTKPRIFRPLESPVDWDR